MSELRHDALSGDDVIVAAGRAARPTTFAIPPSTPGDATAPAECPFCPGNEAMTPPETARIGAGTPGGPGWLVRAFPNLYPIVGGPDAGLGTTGVHEVVALSPDHTRSFGQLGDDAAIAVVTMLRDRVRTHLAAGHAYAFAVVNHLRGAGASIEHPHAQVFALDQVPRAVEAAVARVHAASDDLVAADAGPDGLTIRRAPVWVWCPHASASPYFARIAHPAAGACFETATDAVVAGIAVALRDTLRALSAVMGDVPYNIVVRTAPADATAYHWYVDVIPRLSVVAGFEQGTGILVNVVPPEQAACELRNALG